MSSLHTLPSTFKVPDEDSLQFLPDYMSLHPRRQWSSLPLLKECQILHHTDWFNANHASVLPTAPIAVTHHFVWSENKAYSSVNICAYILPIAQFVCIPLFVEHSCLTVHCTNIIRQTNLVLFFRTLRRRRCCRLLWVTVLMVRPVFRMWVRVCFFGTLVTESVSTFLCNVQAQWLTINLYYWFSTVGWSPLY